MSVSRYATWRPGTPTNRAVLATESPLWRCSIAADDKSGTPPHRDPPAGLLLRPHTGDADGEVEAGRLDDGQRIATERSFQADHVDGAIRAVSLPEGSERSAAQLRSLAAIVPCEERVAIERRIENAFDEQRLRLDRRRRAADGHPAPLRQRAGQLEPAGAEDGAGGGAQVAPRVGGEVDALGGDLALTGAESCLDECVPFGRAEARPTLVAPQRSCTYAHPRQRKLGVPRRPQLAAAAAVVAQREEVRADVRGPAAPDGCERAAAIGGDKERVEPADHVAEAEAELVIMFEGGVDATEEGGELLAADAVVVCGDGVGAQSSPP